MLRKAIAALTVAACALLAAGTAAAQEKFIGPFYNPHTKSYFGLVNTVMGSRSWNEAAKDATSRWHKGVRGRLAIVRDRETHDFLMNKFGREMDADTWIGLRYFCSFRKLMWIDGQVMDQSPPGVWSPQWFRNASTTCGHGRMQFMPVYYANMGAFAGWQASGQVKKFYDYFIEFPTGKP